MLAFELGSTKWTLGFTTAPAQRPRVRTMTAGDLPALEKEIQLAKARFGLPREAPVRSCYEAGRDGFWLHRWLIAQRRRERGGGFLEHRSQSAGAPGEDGSPGCRQVAGAAPAVARGERKVWSVVHVPSPEAEAQRQLTREIATVREDRKRVRNRIQALLATQGIRLELGATVPGAAGRRRRPATAGRCRRRSASGSRASGRTWTPSRRGWRP